MRWKLLVATSLVAALVAACGSYGFIYLLYHFRRPYPATLTMLIIVELVYLLISVSASMLVYRHTARRRKLQALLTLLLCLLLAHAFLRLGTLLAPIFMSS
ncbi:MAG TPA: hypothetical protein VE775_05145 [Pyrinomonadaceae bacterium]|nr:hypothetical protein [Pyrinomonadaceae bacterium]